MVKAAAPEIDRLVWAVGDAVRDAYPEMASVSSLSRPAFGTLVNLLPFAGELTETIVRRRYIYRPEPVLAEFLTELETGGFVLRDGDRLRPTERLAPITVEVHQIVAQAAAGLWQENLDAVEQASVMSRAILDAGPERDGLTQVAQRAAEPIDPFARFWQRLSGLRLLRNEAHVDAWRPLELTARDVEALTEAWSGSALQAPVAYSDRLVERGLVADGAVTEAGVATRQQIEDVTNDGVADAFSVIDHQSFTDILRTLAPEHPTRRG